MRFRLYHPPVVLGLVLFLAAAAFGAQPAVSLPAAEYTFPPTVDGVEVVHDYMIRNKGDAPLKIEKVKTG